MDVDLAMVKDSGLQGGNIRVDGGMTANSLLMQTQADLLGISTSHIPASSYIPRANGCNLSALHPSYFTFRSYVREINVDHLTVSCG